MVKDRVLGALQTKLTRKDLRMALSPNTIRKEEEEEQNALDAGGEWAIPQGDPGWEARAAKMKEIETLKRLELHVRGETARRALVAAQEPHAQAARTSGGRIAQAAAEIRSLVVGEDAKEASYVSIGRRLPRILSPQQR